jgi:hypothetical protein
MVRLRFPSIPTSQYVEASSTAGSYDHVPRFSFLFRDAGLLDFGAPPIDAAIGMLSSSLLSSSTHRCLFAMRRNRKGKDKMMKAQKKLEERKEERRKKKQERREKKQQRSKTREETSTNLLQAS